MEPASFDEANIALSPPKGVKEDEVSSLSVWRGKIGDWDGYVSCWKVTEEELEEIRKTGRVWLLVYSNGMPPVCVTGLSPFRKEPDASPPA